MLSSISSNSGFTTVNNVVIPTLKLNNNSNIPTTSITSPRLPLSARTKSPSASISNTPRINTAPSTARIEGSTKVLHLPAPNSARERDPAAITHLQNNFISSLNNSSKHILQDSNSLQPLLQSPRLDTLLSPRDENPFHRSGNILVVVRVRPESMFEKAMRDSSKNPSRNLVKVVDKHMLVFDPTDEDETSLSPHKRRALGVRRGKDLTYVFDKVFGENNSQMQVYESTTRYLLDEVLDGYNATVFAYGATGAGKTYTMLGSDSSGPGVMFLTMVDLFAMMEKTKDKKNYDVHISYLEVYNETIRDLLADKPPSDKDPGLEIREDKDRGVFVAGISQHQPKTVNEVLEYLKKGNNNRAMYGTAANAQSSRSHAVFQIFIEQRDRTADVRANVKYSKLSLIDLAGSERAAVTKNRGKRLVEGANINKSLLALANCINALGKKNGETKFVPYRDSKLTRLLKDSLGGNCRTIMIANISPSSLCYEDTHNTLKYADRAKNIKINLRKNVLNINVHISNYKKIIDDQKIEIEELKRKLDIAEKNTITDKVYKDYEKEKEEMLKQRKLLTAAFSEQLELRTKLMDLEEANRQNALSVIKKQAEIDRWEREHPNEDDPVRITHTKKEIENLINISQNNTDKKDAIESQLQQNMKKTKIIAEKVPLNVSNPEFRQFLEQQVRLHEKEITNLDLERMVQHHRAREQRMSLLLDDNQCNQAKVKEIIHEFYKNISDLTSNNVPEYLYHKYLEAIELCSSSKDLSESTSEVFTASPQESEVSSKHILFKPVFKETQVIRDDAFKTPKGLNSKSKNIKLSFSGSKPIVLRDHDEDESSEEESIMIDISPSPKHQNPIIPPLSLPPAQVDTPRPSVISNAHPRAATAPSVYTLNNQAKEKRAKTPSKVTAVMLTTHSHNSSDETPSTSIDPTTKQLQEAFDQTLQDFQMYKSEWDTNATTSKINRLRALRKQVNVVTPRYKPSPERTSTAPTTSSNNNLTKVHLSASVSSIHNSNNNVNNNIAPQTTVQPLIKRVKLDAPPSTAALPPSSFTAVPKYMQTTVSSQNRVKKPLNGKAAPVILANGLVSFQDSWMTNLRSTATVNSTIPANPNPATTNPTTPREVFSKLSENKENANVKKITLASKTYEQPLQKPTLKTTPRF